MFIDTLSRCEIFVINKKKETSFTLRPSQRHCPSAVHSRYRFCLRRELPVQDHTSTHLSFVHKARTRSSVAAFVRPFHQPDVGGKRNKRDSPLLHFHTKILRIYVWMTVHLFVYLCTRAVPPGSPCDTGYRLSVQQQ